MERGTFTPDFKIRSQEHKWERGQTNEYCIHCGLIYESDLGWNSSDGVKCIERIEEVTFGNLPVEIFSYVNFRGLIWDKNEKIFNKPFSSESYTVKQIFEIIC